MFGKKNKGTKIFVILFVVILLGSLTYLIMNDKNNVNSKLSELYDGIKSLFSKESRSVPVHRVPDDLTINMDEIEPKEIKFNEEEVLGSGLEQPSFEQPQLLSNIESTSGSPIAYVSEIIESRPMGFRESQDYVRNTGFVPKRQRGPDLGPKRLAEEYYNLEIDCPRGCALIGKNKTYGCIDPINDPDNCVFARDCRGCKEYDVEIFEQV